ncbi:MAG: hypothetical protein VZS44_04100 [Bacilli bacterium]|nr:hypothetical protein [Bacilli bacterium]
MEDEGLNKKYIIGIGVLVLIVIVLLFIHLINKSNKPNEIEVVLKNTGFTLKDGIYVKQKSKLSRDVYFNKVAEGKDAYNEMLYFDINKYELKHISYDYYKGMTTKLTSTYDYKKDVLSYTNDISYESNNYVFEGKYEKEDDFDCNLVKSVGPSIDDSEVEYICSTIEIGVNKFYTEVGELFENTDIREKIKNN